jgi:hypothetical protein
MIDFFLLFSTAIVFLIVIVITIKLYDQKNEIYWQNVFHSPIAINNFTHKRQKYLKIILTHFFLFHCTLSMHVSSTRTGLKVDADNIPELGGFLSRDFGSKYHNLYMTNRPQVKSASKWKSNRPQKIKIKKE